jgi:hypothetical protein
VTSRLDWTDALIAVGSLGIIGGLALAWLPLALMAAGLLVLVAAVVEGRGRR